MNRIQDIIDNPHLLMFYVKQKCSSCRGRGIKIVGFCNKVDNTWSEHKTLCHCVKNALKREAKELEKTTKAAMAGKSS